MRHVALRYMTRFQCIGPECEDTCCQEWVVPIDEAHHRALDRAMGKTYRLRTRKPPERTRACFTIVDHRADGFCKFLDADRLCEIHRQHGEALLPDTCAMYPRRVSTTATRVEVTAVLSCPEAARQALLTDEATEIVPCDPAVAGRAIAVQSIPEDVQSPYAAGLDLVRGAMYAALMRDDRPVDARLFAIAELGDRLDDFLVDETIAVDPARLPAEIARLEDDAVLAASAQRLRDARVAPELAPSAVMQILAERLQRPAPKAFRRLVDDAVATIPAITRHGDELQVHGAALAHHLEGRRAEVGDRVDPYVARYSRNWVMSDWFVFAPSLAIHVQRHLVRVAITRLLLICQPRPIDDRLVVEVFYATSRALEHSDALVYPIIEQRLAGIPSLAAAAALLRI